MSQNLMFSSVNTLSIRTLGNILLAVFGLALVIPSSGVSDVVPISNDKMVAEPVEQCAQLIKECFASAKEEQANCMFSSSKHPFCEGTRLGKLTYKRWIMSPLKSGGDEKVPAFLGPKLIDQQCLENFDSAWLAALITPEILSQRLELLSKQLSGCTKQLSEELTRP